jgi:hypothetical protein
MEECKVQIQVTLWEGELMAGRMPEETLLLGVGSGAGVEVEEGGKVEVEAVMEVIGADRGSPTQTIQTMKGIMI